MSGLARRPLRIFIIAGEESGDALGGPLMRALAQKAAGPIAFRGVGGARMQAEGLVSLFPMDDLTAIGFGEVIGKLPTILARLRMALAAVLADPPDLLLLIDAPDFTHRLAARVRQRLPWLPIVKYVAPTVWAWRPGRARAMRDFVDHVLALLPFEPKVMAELGGPPTTYVGHPLLGALSRLRPDAGEAERRQADPPRILVLPGSRRREIARLSADFGAALGRIAAEGAAFDLVLPTLPRLEAELCAATAAWPVRPRIVSGDAEKEAAFRTARAALAASGTVTLELALAAVPLVAAYRLAGWEAAIGRRLLKVSSVILPNIILGRNAVPEFLQERCTPANLAAALAPLVTDAAAREAQRTAFAELDRLMSTGGIPAAELAAETVLAVLADLGGRVARAQRAVLS